MKIKLSLGGPGLNDIALVIYAKEPFVYVYCDKTSL